MCWVNDMGKKRKGKFAKSQAERHAYRNYVEKSNFAIMDTTPSNDGMLIGSDEVITSAEDFHSNDKIKKTPVKYRIIDFFKKNIFASILAAIIVAAAGTVIKHEVNLAVLTQRVSSIEHEIELLRTNKVEYDLL